MKKNYILLLLIIFINSLFFGQTTLTAGDIAIIEMQGDAPDGFRFVPLVDLEEGTIVKFTDNGWTGTQIRSGEGIVVYTAPPGGITAGTNIRYTVGNTENFSLETSDVNISSSGDQILIYQGDTSSPTFIFAVAGNSTTWQTGSNDSNQTDLPTGLTNGVNAVAAGSGTGAEDEYDNVYYSGITSGSRTAILEALANVANWTGDNTGTAALTTNFTINSSTDPSLTITDPLDGETVEAINHVDIKFVVENFTVASDSSGDGYIKYTVNDGTPVDKFDTTDIRITLTGFNATYTVYMELVDNNGDVLSPEVNQTTTFSTSFPCIAPVDIITVCNMEALGNYTYKIAFKFTGGNTGRTYTITAKDNDNGNNVGTIGGDNPNNNASGSIIIADIPEGIDVAINIADAGDICGINTVVNSPNCESFSVYESFDYAVDTDLAASSLWQNVSDTSADNIKIVEGTIKSPYDSSQFPDPAGNMIRFSSSGNDSYIEFNEQNSGLIYTSFIFSVDDIAAITNTDGGYFVVLAESDGSYKAKLWLNKDNADNTKFNIGISTVNSNNAEMYEATSYAINEEIFIVMAYNFITNQAKVWINPDPTDFEAISIPTATITAAAGTATNLGRFLLRQDSSSETPIINFDELRISNSWSGVTPKVAVASVNDNSIEDFRVYPNPVVNKRFTISMVNLSTEKQISIFNVLGKKVFSQTFLGNSKSINVSNLNAGIYILKAVEGDKIVTKKLIIK